jgi:uncharacterized protein with ParB-like and HNH nuclease domain
MIDAKKVTFTDLFTSTVNAQIRVPDYQRGYSWEKPQVRDFFTDLTVFSEIEIQKRPDTFYFLGPIVLMQGNPNDIYSYVVDGQQRLATFIILLAVIRDVAREKYELSGRDLADNIHNQIISSQGPQGRHRWAYRLGDLDQAYFEKFVLRQPREKNKIPNNASNGLIKRAWNQLEQNIRDKLSAKEDGLGYLQKLVSDLLNKVELVAIEVKTERDAMNVFERINVRGKPLSETDLIRHRLMSSCNKHDRSRLRSEWDNLEKLLGEDAKIDSFLKHMWISRNGERTSTKLYDEISNYLDDSNISSMEFVENIVNDCRIYTELLKPESQLIHYDSRASVRISHATLGAKQSLPLFLSAYRRFERTPRFSELALAVEALIVRYTYFANRDSLELTNALYRAAKAITEASSKDQALQNALISLKSVNPTNAEVVTGSQRQMKMKKLPALYILRQLENSLGDGSFDAKATLEHIFPQNAAVEEWKSAVGRLNPYVSHIGNLTLLSSSDNSRASNKKFSYKKRKVYESSNIKLTSEITQFRNWGIKPILRRAESLAKLANKRWMIN